MTPLSFAVDPSDVNRGVYDPGVGHATGRSECQRVVRQWWRNGHQRPRLRFWTAIAVTKVVEGTPPAGSTFTVHVACSFEAGGTPVVEADLNYQSSGGLQYVYSDLLGGDCAFTEPGNGGALSTTIEPDHVTVFPEASAVTVTNGFVQRAVVIQPRFTG